MKTQQIELKLINIQGLSKHKVIEVENLVNQQTILCLTETQQRVDITNWNNDYTTYVSMRGKEDKKGGGLMMLHRNDEIFDLHQETAGSNKDILIVRGKLKGRCVTIILVYLSVVKGEEERKCNLQIKNEIKKKIRNLEDDILILLGDFNGHLGFIGDQPQNFNGKIVLDIMTECNLILINGTEKCNGTITWSRRDQRSAIDFILMNNKGYQICEQMKIDEGQDEFDLSDHKLINLDLKMDSVRHNFDKNSKWIEGEYYKFDEVLVKEYIAQMEVMLQTEEISTIEEFNNIMETTATQLLRRTYKRRIAYDQKKVEVVEAPWMTIEIRAEIKKRRKLNRDKRNCREEDKEEAIQVYFNQKRKVQHLIHAAMNQHEAQVTMDIKKDKGRGMKLWDNIDKLRGKKKKKKEDDKLYSENGQQLNKEESEVEIEKYWTEIYRRYENNTDDLWNEETKEVYQEVIDQEKKDKDVIRHGNSKFPSALREHFDCQLRIKSTVHPMEDPHITRNEVKTYMKKIKKKKATGPDKLKGELYSVLEQSELCVMTLRNILQSIMDNDTKVDAWEKSDTKMIPKTKKPTAAQLRPIALTDVSYKLYMTIQGKKIDKHILDNNMQMETQAGFTKGSQIEDNLFILQYCIEQNFRRRKPLVVTCIDYSKAYDSIRRETIVETLMHYRVHPKIIDTIVNIYRNDHTDVHIGDIKKNIKITSGIRQGCTGSAMLFKLITYMIIEELNNRGSGYKDDIININSLYFADDGLLLANSIEEAAVNLKIIIQISRHFGLEINKAKSNVMIFNMKEQPDNIEDIEVVNKITYLGIEIDNKRSYFKSQRTKMIEKARKMANMTYSIIEKGCNRLLIGKTYWKSIALPSILYGVNVINLSEDDIKDLQVIENDVYRTILNAPGYAPNTTLRSEIGSSLMKKRIMNGRINFIKSILHGRNKLLESILHRVLLENDTSWIKVSRKYINEVQLNVNDIERKSKEEIKNIFMKWDKDQWTNEIACKSTLKIYRDQKHNIEEEQMYDNRPSSAIWFRARINALQLGDRNRHTNKETHCQICEGENIKEDILHFMLHCPVYKEERHRVIELQQPYFDNEEEIIGSFLFNKENTEQKKEVLYQMWKKRDCKLKTLRRELQRNC